MKKISQQKLIKKIKSDEKNFKNIECKGINFPKMELDKINFINCNLNFSSFADCIIKNCKIENTALFWSDFSRSKIYHTSFKGSKLTWSKLNDAYFENCDLANASLQWSIAFDSNIMQGCKIKNTNLAWFAKSLSEVTPTGLKIAYEELQKLKSSMPSELYKILESSVKKTNEQLDITTEVKEAVKIYKKKEGIHSFEEENKEKYSTETKAYSKKKTKYQKGPDVEGIYKK